MEHDWDTQATFMGYETKYHMFHDMYEVKGLSVNQIARRCGSANTTVTQQLRKVGIELRPRGGAHQQPRKQYHMHCMDQRFIFSNTLHRLASHMNMSVSYILKYKQMVRGVHTDALRSNSADLSDVAVFDETENPDGFGPGEE